MNIIVDDFLDVNIQKNIKIEKNFLYGCYCYHFLSNPLLFYFLYGKILKLLKRNPLYEDISIHMLIERILL